MGRYRKKPVEIEAFQFGPDVWPEWFLEQTDRIVFEKDCALIPTLEGTMKVSPGDYVIRGVKGEIYPCKPDIFAQTYEEVPYA